ncbi:MAG: hypothetical protein JSU63_21635 [Phycisphaerales bacterium]|nr:MAG: hypothetical protein JSU63_21635 [Phycisphaerales bacterium]
MRSKNILVTVAIGFSVLLTACAPRTTLKNNPTTLAGRGEPSITDEQRPSAWIYIDGHGGKFTEKEGVNQIQWVIEDPVSSTPTFRVEALPDLLGTPKDFKCVLYTYASEDGSNVGYGIAAKEGTFKVGYDYPLLNPGSDFVVRIAGTEDILDQIEPLAPGSYMLTAGVENAEMGVKTLAVSYFTVGQAE